MSKKQRGKSASGPSGPTKWETALTTLPLNEEGVWEACTALVLGRHLEDNQFIGALGHTIQGGSRKLFTFVSYDDLMKNVQDFGNPKAKKGKEAPANFEVCEPCKAHLDAGEEIPLPLLARLVKFRLLWAKADDQRRREAEKKAAEGGDKGRGGKAGKGGAGADKGAKGGAGGKGSAKGKGAGGGKKEPEPASVKEASKMFKRGEPDPSAVNINDEPEDGAQLYLVRFLHCIDFRTQRQQGRHEIGAAISRIYGDVVRHDGEARKSMSDKTSESSFTVRPQNLDRLRAPSGKIYGPKGPMVPVTHLFFVIFTFRDTDIARFRNPQLQVFDQRNPQTPLCSTNLQPRAKGLVVCLLSRPGRRGAWQVTDVGQPLAEGSIRNYKSVVQVCADIIQRQQT